MTPRPSRLLLAAALLALLVAPRPGAAIDRPDPARFESEIRAFEVADSTAPAPRGAVVFYGSSQPAHVASAPRG